MDNQIRILLLGTGQMGSGIGRLLLEKPGLDLVGAYARRKQRQGMDLGHAIGHRQELNIPVSGDLPAIINETQPHVAIQATCSTLDDAKNEITTLVRHNVNVISIAEEMAYPACSSPAFAEELHELALTHGVGILGTGINPGFVLDLLIITLSGVCSDIQSITARRVNDLAPYGPSVLASQGVGLAPEEFARELENGRVVGHVGFKESISMIGAAVGWEIERIEQSREPIISKVRRRTAFVTVEPGQAAGCFHKAVGYRQGKPIITLIHPQQIHPHLEGITTGDTIEIQGTPDIRLAGSPEIPGGIGTCALAVNMIPRLLKSKPGLHCMADLPAPAAILGDARNLIRTNF
jgi:4-hydroxy-tetrahydrodipicolinate reductase